MTYEQAKIIQEQLEENNKVAGKAVKYFDQYRNAMGLLPDNIRESEEYQTVKKTLDKSFAELREFNGWFVKKFKKEYAAERKNRFKKQTI